MCNKYIIHRVNGRLPVQIFSNKKIRSTVYWRHGVRTHYMHSVRMLSSFVLKSSNWARQWASLQRCRVARTAPRNYFSSTAHYATRPVNPCWCTGTSAQAHIDKSETFSKQERPRSSCEPTKFQINCLTREILCLYSKIVCSKIKRKLTSLAVCSRSTYLFLQRQYDSNVIRVLEQFQQTNERFMT